MLFHSEELLGKISYLLVKNKRDFQIKKVVLNSKKIVDNSLLFHLKKERIAPNHLNAFSDTFIVTNDLEVFRNIDNGMVVYVADIKKAYWEFIDFYRGQFQIPVVGITGTCGKTTVKEMLFHLLKERYIVQGTLWSQNGTHLNLSYLLNLKKNTEVAVYEMGVARPGNILQSARYFKPAIGIITNIGEAHLDGCRTIDQYVKAKGELLEVLSEKGILIINGDDENIKELPIATFTGKIVTFGIKNEADFRAFYIKHEDGGMSFQLRFKDKNYPIFIPEYGEHQVYNSLATIAAAYQVGVACEDAAKQLRKFKGLPRHTKFYIGPDGCTVIDDTWSCNPSSVRSALKVLKELSQEKRKLLVLGKMQRLGKQLQEQHKKIADTVLETGSVDFLITVGDAAALTGKRAIEQGMHSDNVFFVKSASELDVLLRSLSREDVVILFKMSLGKMPVSYREVVRNYRNTK